MAINQERFAAMGYRVHYISEQLRKNLLTQIYTLLLTSTAPISEVALMDFKAFYLEMLLGLDPEAREAGAQPKTVEDLEAKIRGLTLPGDLEKACLSLADGMKPPPPF